MGYENTTNPEIRELLGERLAAKYKPIGDYIIPIPFSGFSFAAGVARYYENNPAPDITKNIHHHRQIQLEYAIQANRYAGRTFITPETPQGRMLKASLKYNFIPKYIKDRNLILVDDSVVRGATMQGLILNLFRLGAKNITLLIGVPPIKNPCYWGIDFANPKELIFNQLNWTDDSSFEEQLALWLTGGDTELAKYLRVHFQTREDYVSIVQNVPYGTALTESGGCFHCIGGPTPEGALVDEEMQKNRFEDSK
jgi:adenine/guanine phosphoribosyltransferase-like PRPP-binding protein